MKLNCYCGTIDNRNLYEISDSDTILSLMQKCSEEHGVNFSTGKTEFNGYPVSPMDVNKTFAEFHAAHFGADAMPDTIFLANSPKSTGA